MPVKTGLKLMTPISSDRVDSERILLNHIIDELDRTILVMFRIDL